MGRLQTARLENFIRRWGSIKGPGSVLSETLGDVFPVLDLENLTPENYLTAGWYPFCGFTNVIGVAAQTTGASIINPAGSGAILVVDFVNIRRETTGIVGVGADVPLFTPIINGARRDTRAGAFSGIARIGANANVGAHVDCLQLRLTGNVDRQLELPHGVAILGPGTQLAVINTTTNNDLTVSFSGRVRIAEPSELSF